jgi:hypothetical protein
MAEAMCGTSAKGRNHGLLPAHRSAQRYVWQVDTEIWIQDAEREGDSELAEWFRKLQCDTRRAS